MAVNLQAVIWLLILVILLAIEAATLGLTTIWFAGGALAAFVSTLAGAGLFAQLVCFCLVSVILLIFTRPAALRWLNRDRTKTNAASLVGAPAIVTVTIDNMKGEGQVQVRGQEWTARSQEDETVIPSGRRVVVQSISGVKLIVKEELL